MRMAPRRLQRIVHRTEARIINQGKLDQSTADTVGLVAPVRSAVHPSSTRDEGSSDAAIATLGEAVSVEFEHGRAGRTAVLKLQR